MKDTLAWMSRGPESHGCSKKIRMVSFEVLQMTACVQPEWLADPDEFIES